MISLLAISLAGAALQGQATPASGLIITKSTVLKPGNYLIASADKDGRPNGAIQIRGDNITVDFKGATLRGTPADSAPDKRGGTAVEVRGRNVTIKNAKIHGYKNAVVAWDSPGLKILDSDFSYNWKQHLMSTLEREDLSDWMSYHQNEKDEWLRYGGAMYLRGCDNFEVKNVKVHGGQNGLMITECDKGLIWNNDFSFNSSLGLGMYRSSENRIMHNKMDWNVRGFSYGVYNRGQDSAGILIYEQSNRNVFAYNSVTHSGDGFFLWAGQTTMDTGEGGCNDNLLYGNDWSHAPTNGIEATFSRNNFVNNLIMECWHGIWGGYSYDSKTIGNIFAYNTEGIAWEHGQDNLVRGNTFFRNGTDIYIWMNQNQDPNWVYPKRRDTKSRDWTIVDNVFAHTTQGVRQVNGAQQDPGAVLRMFATEDMNFGANHFRPVGTLFDLRGPSKNFNAAAGRIQGEESSERGEVMVTEREVSTWEAIKIEQLGSGWEAANRGQYMLAGVTTGVLPPASALTANRNQPPNPAEYLGRFKNNWNPLSTSAGKQVSIGADPAGRNLHTVSAEALSYAPAPLRGGINPFLKPDQLRGWFYMIVDEWGPYDFKSPILFQRSGLREDGTMLFELIGPKGVARAVEQTGLEIASVSTDGGNSWRVGESLAGQLPVPSLVLVRQTQPTAMSRLLELEYRGAKIVTPFGQEIAAGQPYRFRYSKFHVPFQWDVRWYAWDRTSVQDPKAAMPTPGQLLSRTELQNPLRREKTDTLNYAWGGSPGQGVPADHFITLADGTFEVPSGTYTLNVTTDDGVRVWVDDELVIKDAWKYQGPTLYTAELKLSGRHRIRVEHYEIDGYSALKVELVPKR